VIGEETVSDPIFVWAGGTREQAVQNDPNVEVLITKSGFNSKLGCTNVDQDRSITMTSGVLNKKGETAYAKYSYLEGQL
jgi:hypothetical protein